jgi:hypothetical protein
MIAREDRHVTIDLFEGRGKVAIGDVDISMLTAAVTVTSSVGEYPCVTLTLEPRSVSINLDGAKIDVDDETRAALLAIGWVPSEER